MDKGCSSKSFFQGLHTHRQKCSYLKVRKLDGTWTQSLTELDHECQDHFQYLFAAPSAPTQSMIDNRQALLTHVKPIMQQHDAFSLEQPFTAEELHDALLHLGKGKASEWNAIWIFGMT